MTMTNTTKANIIAIVNTGLVLLLAFGVNVSEAQMVGITAFVNAGLVLFVGLTYKNSAKRISE